MLNIIIQDLSRYSLLNQSEGWARIIAPPGHMDCQGSGPGQWILSGGSGNRCLLHDQSRHGIVVGLAGGLAAVGCGGLRQGRQADPRGYSLHALYGNLHSGRRRLLKAGHGLHGSSRLHGRDRVRRGRRRSRWWWCVYCCCCCRRMVVVMVVKVVHR